MPTLTRLRQLANGQHVVETATLEDGRAIYFADWQEVATFLCEKDAELYARTIADREAAKGTEGGRCRSKTPSPRMRPTGNFWLWPNRATRKRIA